MGRINHRSVGALVLLAVGLGFQTPATGEDTAITVADLRDDCLADKSIGGEDDAADDRAGLRTTTGCRGYMNGYLDALYMFRDVSDRAADHGGGKSSVADRVNPARCIDSRLTVEQSVHAFSTWADAHPESWQELAGVGMLAALRLTFCE